MGMSSTVLGGRLGMTGQGVRKLEQAEADGTITLKTLTRLAQGLNCEVCYVLVPRTSLVEQVLTRAQEVAGAPPLLTPHSVTLLGEAEALEAISKLMKQVNRRGFWQVRPPGGPASGRE